MPFLDARALVAAATLLLIAAPQAHGTPHWPWPVRGQVVARFAVGPDPYARGQHRGIDIAAPPGAAVRSACGGRVRYAGRVAAFGRTVSVECGPWIVSYGHLGSVSARRGARVATGQNLGTVGAALHLGVRRRGERHGYADPLAFLADPGLPAGDPGLPVAGPPPAPRPVPPPPVLPTGPAVSRPARTPQPVPSSMPVSRPRPRPRPVTVPASGPPLPVAAWIGAALLGAAVPGLALVGTARRRRRPRARGRREEVIVSP